VTHRPWGSRGDHSQARECRASSPLRAGPRTVRTNCFFHLSGGRHCNIPKLSGVKSEKWTRSLIAFIIIYSSNI
jgi:hypothetical protein